MSGIVIHRSRHAQEFVVVPNSIARDSRLSFLARGLLVFLLSLPPEWSVTVDQLASWNPDARGPLRAAMKSLRDLGYVVLVTQRGPDGRTRRHLEVYDTDETKRRLLAVGPTSGNRVNPQVAPNATRPNATRPAINKKTGSRGGPTASPPPRSDQLCARCGSGYHTAGECPA